jgi:uncharacterized integral membrane protein (TIGR00698 family)
MVVAISFAFFLARLFSVTRITALLLGVGTAICGGSAIMAVAPVVKAEKQEVAVCVATISFLGLFMMFLLPVLGAALKLSPTQYGLLAGLSIHQTPQVIAAGFAYAPQAGDYATVVKLARICWLGPLVFLIGLFENRRGAATETASTSSLFIPWFAVGFLVMAALRTIGAFPESILPAISNVATFCLVLSMAGVGLETQFAKLRQSGVSAFALGSALSIIVLLLALAFIQLAPG